VAYMVRAINEKTGQVRYLASKQRTDRSDDHVLHGSLLTADIEEAYRYTSYPDAKAAEGVLEAQIDTEDLTYDVIEAA
jgi:hypothetical protein